jgi:hypothetical protein
MERELAKLVKDAAKSANDMEKSFNAANNNIGKGANAAFNGAARGANQATGAIRNTSGATANLASQLNDIGVQLAGGTSPFLVMLQQGTQITQLFQQTGGSIRSFGSILAGAVTSVLNPFSLLTFAIIGAGGYAIQYFSSIVSGGEESNKVIEEQRRLIEGVAKTWGDAVPALQAYVDQLERAKNADELIAAGDIVNEETIATVTARIDEIRTSFQDLVANLQAAGEETDVIVGLQEAFNDFTAAAQEGKDVTEETKAVQDALAAAINSSGIPAISEWASMFGVLSSAAASAAASVANVNAQVAKALNGPSIQDIVAGSTFTDKDGKVRFTSGFEPTGNAPTPESRPPIELEGLPGQFKSDGTLKGAKRGRGGGGRGANAYKSEVEGIKERTAALRESTAAQAAVNPLVSDYGFALEKAKAEQKLLADAQRAGMAITPALREQISALAGGYAQASADAKKLSESQREIQQNAEEWASLEKDVFKGFISDLKEGKSGAEALSNALTKVADKLLDMAVDGLFSTKGASGGGSGLFGALLGGIGKIFGFASGTSNTGGKRGEPRGVVHGQEAVIPLPAGGKVPVQLNTPSSAAMGRAPSRDTVDIRLADDSGRMADIADQRIQTASGTIVKISVDQSYKTVRSNFAGLMTDTQSRNFS